MVTLFPGDHPDKEELPLGNSEAEFVTASQTGQEVVYLRELLKGFGHPQKKPTEIWEDNASCIMMSENPTNRDRSRYVDVKVHYHGDRFVMDM
jgi:hypothetical protein